MKKVLIIVTIILLIIVGALTQYQRVLIRYASFFSIHNASKGADALVVLAGGIITRLPYAIKLYQQGYAARIILTQQRHPYPRLKHLWGDDWNIAKEITQSLNITVHLVYLPSLKTGGVTSTFDEAYDIKQYSVQQHFKHIIIVTDSYHTRRSLYAFKKVMQETGIRLEAAGTENDLFNASNWWQSDAGISAYVLEGIKYVAYHLSDRNVSFLKNY
jgi:uncharacterized SAM-binding protein YcdF (DUF218 family)